MADTDHSTSDTTDSGAGVEPFTPQPAEAEVTGMPATPDEGAPAEDPLDDAAPEELGASRDILVGHVEAMHRIQEPWDASAHDAISALAALTRLHPSPRTSVRLPGSVAAQMVGEDRDRYAEALREAAEVGVLSTGPEQTAWYGAPISSEGLAGSR